jgi:hypothetical protein
LDELCHAAVLLQLANRKQTVSPRHRR